MRIAGCAGRIRPRPDPAPEVVAVLAPREPGHPHVYFAEHGLLSLHSNSHYGARTSGRFSLRQREAQEIARKRSGCRTLKRDKSRAPGQNENCCSLHALTRAQRASPAGKVCKRTGGHSPTGEPDAGNPPVRFGGRSEVTSLVPTSIAFNFPTGRGGSPRPSAGLSCLPGGKGGRFMAVRWQECLKI